MQILCQDNNLDLIPGDGITSTNISEGRSEIQHDVQDELGTQSKYN